jgi:hypothetical protein
MAVRSVSCPGCQKVLRMTHAPRGNLRCPRCQVRFHASEDGKTEIITDISGSPSYSSRIGVLAAIGTGGALFVTLGIALFIYCLQAPSVTEAEDETNDDPYRLSQPAPRLPVVRVAFVKKGPPAAARGAGTLADCDHDANWPPAVAKDVCSPEALSPANQKEIDTAIDRGVAYLNKAFDDKGRPIPATPGPHSLLPGTSALVGLTLLTCGMAAEDPKLAGITARIRKDPQVEKALLYLGQRIGRADLRDPSVESVTAAALAKARNELKDIQAKTKSASKDQKDALNKRKLELTKEIAAATAAASPNQRGGIVHAASWGDYYFLWSLERVAVVYGLRTIGGQDWYAWGSEVIVGHQRPDGSWGDSFAGPVDTCFALLFLKRANVAVDLTKILQSLGGARDPGGLPGQEQTTTAFGSFSGIKPIPVLLAGMAKSRFAFAPAPTLPALPYQLKD